MLKFGVPIPSALFFYFTCLIGTEIADDSNDPPLLLVLSFDGLRADFLNPFLMPNLWNLARSGVFAPRGIKPQFLTDTTPNFYSIATGLYQENHGIIGNTFYDPGFNEKYEYWDWFDMFMDLRSRHQKWYSGEPIWKTHSKSGGNSGCMHWPTCDIRWKNFTSSRFLPWNTIGDLNEWTKNMEQLLNWFIDKTNPINFGLFYIMEPDETEHNNDIYSDKVKMKLKKLDTLEIRERINIIFIADHGHANVYINKPHALINLDEIMDPRDAIWSGKSMFPNKTRGVTAEELYDKLQAGRAKSPRFDIWWKQDVPDQYHYKNNRRIGPIVLVERLGYRFTWNNYKPSLPISGCHGFLNDNIEMWPAFFAVGPAFKRNLTIDWEIENVDLYNLMAAVLKINPAPNDGDFRRVAPLLRDRQLATKFGIENFPEKFGTSDGRENGKRVGSSGNAQNCSPSTNAFEIFMKSCLLLITIEILKRH